MPSQDEIEQYREDVEEVSALAVAEVTAVIVAASEDGEDPDALVRAIPGVLEPFMVAAGELAVDWYRSLARRTPRRVVAETEGLEPIAGPTARIALLDAQEFEPRAAPLPPREQIESTVWWALHEPLEPAPVDTADAEPGQGSPSSPVTEARRPRTPSTRTPAPEPEREPEREVEPVSRIEPETEPEQLTRARVIPAREGEPGARVLPADGSELQARVIERMTGAVQRYVTTAARDTVTANAEREQVRWVRDARPDACAFCRLLATKGTTTDDPGYLSEESARRVVGRRGRERGKRKIGELYHDWCKCEPIPIRAGDSYTPPEHLLDWEEQYEKARANSDGSTRAILAAMRAAEKARGGSTR